MTHYRVAAESVFITSDNTELFYRHWGSANPNPDKIIVLFHRGHEHSGRLQHIVDELNRPDVPMYAWMPVATAVHRAGAGLAPV